MNKPTIDELEMLNPDELGELLHTKVSQYYVDVQFVQDLLDVGCPIDARDPWGRTALHYAASGGHLEAVEFMISKGAWVDAQDEDDLAALDFATLNGHLEVVKFLISRGAG